MNDLRSWFYSSGARLFRSASRWPGRNSVRITKTVVGSMDKLTDEEVAWLREADHRLLEEKIRAFRSEFNHTAMEASLKLFHFANEVLEDI